MRANSDSHCGQVIYAFESILNGFLEPGYIAFSPNIVTHDLLKYYRQGRTNGNK